MFSRKTCPRCGGAGELPQPQLASPVAETPRDPDSGADKAAVRVEINEGAPTSSGPGGDVFLMGGETTGTGGDGVLTVGEATNTDAVNITIQGGPSHTDAVLSWPCTSPREKVIPWSARMLEEVQEGNALPSWEETQEGATLPPWIVALPAMAIAPVGDSIFADLLMMLEQHGEEPAAFVMSCRDFADVLKWGSSAHLRWEGTKGWFFEVPLLRSREVPPGYVAAVSHGQKMAVCSVTR